MQAKTRKENWIDMVVNSTKNLETPARYFWWSSIAAISAVAKNQVFLSRGGAYKLYPNIYVALISKHSGLRKGIPVSKVSKLIQGAQCTRVIDGRSSIQAVISEFSKQVTLENGKILNDAQGIMLSGEFDTMLIKDPDALTVLTALYNTHEHNGSWKNTLKSSGVESLKNPCISLLVASNETLFYDQVKQKDVEGGFLARTFVVYEAKKQCINDLIEKDENLIDSEILIKELEEISKVKGEFQWSKEAKELYRPWYHELASSDIDDKTGSVHRLGDSVLKVAMLLNLSNSRDLVLHDYDIETAIEKCQECLGGVRKLTRSTGISDLSPATKIVVDKLVEADGFTMTKANLMRKIHPDVDSDTLNKVIETLEESESIKVFRDDKNKVAYQLTKNAVQFFTKFKTEELEK